MKRQMFVSVLAGLTVLGLAGSGYSDNNFATIVGLSQDVVGTATVSIVSLTGCPTPVCFSNTFSELECTNVVSFSSVCHTNIEPILSCTNVLITVSRCFTNATTGGVACFTNTFPVLVCTTNGFETEVNCFTNRTYTRVCFTNLETKLVCTNDFGPTPTVRVSQTIVGPIAPNAACDELGAAMPADAIFSASLLADLRQTDWRGFHAGNFIITSGSNIVAIGTLTGINGAVSQGNPCALCNHLEGSLSGVGTTGGPLSGLRLRADYSGTLTDVACPSTDVPQGAVQLSIDGVVISPCASATAP